MKRKLNFDEIISTKPVLKRRKRLRVSFSSQPPSKFWEVRHRVQQQLQLSKPLSALNQKALNTFTNFIHLEDTSHQPSIYVLLLLDCMILKRSLFFDEKFNGLYLSQYCLQRANCPALDDGVRKRLARILSDNVASIGNNFGANYNTYL